MGLTTFYYLKNGCLVDEEAKNRANMLEPLELREKVIALAQSVATFYAVSGNAVLSQT